MTLSPCQNAPPQDGSEGSTSTEAAAQAPLPPDEHKAVRWEGAKGARPARTEKKDHELANFGFPREDKADVANPLQQCVHFFVVVKSMINHSISQFTIWGDVDVLYGALEI